VTYTFGRICVDAGARRVSRAGRPVHLTRKALDLLLLLLDHRPNAVPKEQIHTHVWPDTFVSEASLQSLVREIRRALEDPAAGPSWILTVHGIGYRFDGNAVAVGDPAQPPPTAQRPVAWLLGDTRRVALLAGENVIGRGDGVLEIDAPTISRHHARITIGSRTIIDDLGSKNGTWVDDQRVTAPIGLADGASVRLGSVALTFRLARKPRPTESARKPAGARGKKI
jgi:DNA-binding winged helix-turn-helix (wHTH) protein